MAQLVADSDGKISGRFTVPPNIPVGTKLMQFVGSEGNYGEASYTARGIITTEERRRVTTLTDIRQQQTTVVVRRFRSDPLAQTFTLNQGRHIGGVDLWVYGREGTRRVIAQIRETTTGIPNQTILAEAHVQAEDINLSGGHTRIEWAPVWLDAGTEYAIVILTDDAEPAVRVAELGKYDAVHERWVTSPIRSVCCFLPQMLAHGTPHQDRDLTFRLLGARFTATTRTIDLGNITVSDVSDVICARQY